LTYFGDNNYTPQGVGPNASCSSNYKYANVTPVGNGADTTEDSAVIIPLPLNTSGTANNGGGLGVNGDSYEFEFLGTFAADANNKTIRLYFGGATPLSGGTKIFDSGALTQNAGAWRLRGRVIRTGAATQIIETDFQISGGTAPSFGYTTTTKTLTSQNSLQLTIQAGTATANEAQMTFSTVRFKPAA
jgi:hypothetical protein